MKTFDRFGLGAWLVFLGWETSRFYYTGEGWYVLVVFLIATVVGIGGRCAYEKWRRRARG